MPRPKGIAETAPRKKGAGRPVTVSYTDMYATDPDGTASITLHLVPLAALDHAERMAKGDGISTQEWIRRLLVREDVRSTIL